MHTHMLTDKPASYCSLRKANDGTIDTSQGISRAIINYLSNYLKPDTNNLGNYVMA